MNDSTSPLSDAQEVVLAVLPLISASLSILGSSIILQHTVFGRCSKGDGSLLLCGGTFHRLLTGLSVADICSSTVNASMALLAPRASSPRIWAMGNDATCATLGFMFQATTAGFMYSGMLSTYYYLTICHGVSAQGMAKKVEPHMHLHALMGPLVSACIGLFAGGGYQEVRLGPGCWTRSSWFGWIFTAVPVTIITVGVIYMQWNIYRHVQSTLQQSHQWTFHGLWGHQHQHNQDASNNHPSEPPSEIELGSPSTHSANSSSHFSFRTIVPTTTTRSATTTMAAQRQSLVATQSFLYVTIFLLVNAWPAVLRMLDDAGYQRAYEDNLYPILVLQAFCLPSQGFWNMLVFLRPRYWTRRRKFASVENKWQSLWAVLRPGASSNTSTPHHFNSDSNSSHRTRQRGGWSPFSRMFGANSTPTRDDDQDVLPFSVDIMPHTGDPSFPEQRPSNVKGVGNVAYDNEIGDCVGASNHESNNRNNGDDHDHDGKLSIIDEVSSHHTAVDLPLASPHPDQELP